jgi:hypothetical protein
MSSPRTKGGGVHTRREVREWEVNILEDARHWIGLLQYNLSAIQSIELGPPTSRAFFFPLDHRGCEIWGLLPPAPPIAASLILPAIFWGQYYVPVRPYALTFFVFSFLYIVFDIFFLLFFSYFSLLFISFHSYLLILLFLSLLILLILIFLYLNLFVVLQTCILII